MRKKKKGKKKKPMSTKETEESMDILLKGHRKKKGKTSQFFVLGATLKGTTSAVIRAETFEQAHWIYTHAVLIPAKRTAERGYHPNRLKGNVYWDGNVYIEKLKLWKKIKGFPVAVIGIRIDLKLVATEDPDNRG